MEKVSLNYFQVTHFLTKLNNDAPLCNDFMDPLSLAQTADDTNFSAENISNVALKKPHRADF